MKHWFRYRKIKRKTLKIAPRFMDVSHLENLNDEDKIKKQQLFGE